MELGAGFVYFSGFEPALERCAGLIDVLEVEPQTFWFSGAAPEDAPRVDHNYLSHVAGLPFPKLVHGVGFPVGGTETPNPCQLPALRETLGALQPPWFSEHLSFNRARGGGGEEFHTAFLLPPCQNEAGARAAIRSIQSLQRAIGTPVAIETGVNYLRPMAHEMPDGEFIARIVEATGCGVLLDLHNIWANERNGRQSVEDFLEALPREQVWELHVAGGHEHRGIWLDAHSGAVPDELLELSGRVVRTLPNLGAVIFEMFPGYLAQGGFDVFERQMIQLRRLWDQRGQELKRSAGRTASPSPAALLNPREWEDTLGSLAIGNAIDTPLGRDLAADPGVPVIAYLIREFRGSVLSRNLKFTCRLLMLELGDAAFMDLLEQFWRQAAPELFGSEEARHFAAYLAQRALPVPGLAELLDFEISTINTLLDGTARVVRFPFDPMPVIRSLAEGKRPVLWKDRDFEMEIIPDPPAADFTESGRGLQILH